MSVTAAKAAMCLCVCPVVVAPPLMLHKPIRDKVARAAGYEPMKPVTHKAVHKSTHHQTRNIPVARAPLTEPCVSGLSSITSQEPEAFTAVKEINSSPSTLNIGYPFGNNVGATSGYYSYPGTPGGFGGFGGFPSGGSSNPGTPSGPTGPTGPTGPSEPSGPDNPTGPNNPGNPTGPVGSAVPEVSTWVFMIIGFGMIGSILRYPKKVKSEG